MKNGKSRVSQSTVSGNVSQSEASKEAVGSRISPDAYKTFDIKKAVEQDLRAAVSLLHLVLDNPQIMDLVVNEIEKIRTKIVEQEGLPKREDFHPELTPAG